MPPLWFSKLEEGKQRRKLHAMDTLSEMLESLRDLQKCYVDVDNLQALKIKVVEVKIDATSDKPLSKYFSPMPFEAWPASLDPDSGYSEAGRDWGRYQDAVVIDLHLREWMHKPIGHDWGENLIQRSVLSEIRTPVMSDNYWEGDPPLDPAKYRWEVVESFAAKGKPHLIFKCRQAVTKEDERVLRTEIFTIISLMIWRMRRKSNAEHEIIPVLMVSVRANYACILTSHFDGEYLQVQRSRVFRPAKFPDAFKLLARHMLSEPVGNTLRL